MEAKTNCVALDSGSLTSWSTTGKQKTCSSCSYTLLFTGKIHSCFTSITLLYHNTFLNLMTFVLYLQQVSVHSRHPYCEHLPLLTSSSYLWLQPCSATGLLQTINTTEGQRQRACSKHSAIFVCCYYLITLVSSANISPVLHLMSTVLHLHSLQHFSSNSRNSNCMK